LDNIAPQYMNVYYISISGSTIQVKLSVVANSPLLLVKKIKGLVLIMNNTYLANNFNTYIPSGAVGVLSSNVAISFSIPNQFGSDLNEKCLLTIFQIFLPSAPSVYNLTFSLSGISSGTVLSIDDLAAIWVLCVAGCD
jgi:hypothetical protein